MRRALRFGHLLSVSSRSYRSGSGKATANLRRGRAQTKSQKELHRHGQQLRSCHLSAAQRQAGTTALHPNGRSHHPFSLETAHDPSQRRKAFSHLLKWMDYRQPATAFPLRVFSRRNSRRLFSPGRKGRTARRQKKPPGFLHPDGSFFVTAFRLSRDYSAIRTFVINILLILFPCLFTLAGYLAESHAGRYYLL